MDTSLKGRQTAIVQKRFFFFAKDVARIFRRDVQV